MSDSLLVVYMLINELDSEYYEVRQRAKHLLANLTPHCVPPLIETLRAFQGRRAWEAASILVDLRDERCIEVMEEVLLCEHPIIAPFSAQALGKFGSRSLDRLLEALPIAPFMTQCAILLALQEIDDTRAVPALISLLRSTHSSVIRYTVIQVLGSLKDPSASEIVRSFECDENHHVRERVHMALCMLQAAQIA